MNMVGTLRISRSRSDGSKVLEVSCITDLDISFSKRVSTVPIVSKGMDTTFPLENGSNMSISFTYSRKNPDEIDDASEDQSKWSNSRWYDMLTSLVNVWQLRYNGFRIQYNDDSNTFLDNTPTIDERGYIKRVTRGYNSKHNTLITGTIDVSIGTAYVETVKPDANESYSFDINLEMTSGNLSSCKIFLSNGAETGITVGEIFPSEALANVKISPSVTYDLLSEWDVVSVAVPYPPALWNTLGNMCRLNFLGWVFKGSTYQPGVQVQISKGDTSAKQFVAKWEVRNG